MGKDGAGGGGGYDSVERRTVYRDAEPKSKDHFLNLIEDWLGYWMNQKQNSEEDFKNYFRRAFGVDANMRHHLAKMLEDDSGKR